MQSLKNDINNHIVSPKIDWEFNESRFREYVHIIRRYMYSSAFDNLTNSKQVQIKSYPNFLDSLRTSLGILESRKIRLKGYIKEQLNSSRANNGQSWLKYAVTRLDEQQLIVDQFFDNSNQFVSALEFSQSLKSKYDRKPSIFSNHLNLINLCLKHPKTLNILINNGFTRLELENCAKDLRAYRDIVEKINTIDDIEKITKNTNLSEYKNELLLQHKNLYERLNISVGSLSLDGLKNSYAKEGSLVHQLSTHQVKPKTPKPKSLIGRLIHFIKSKIYAFLYGSRDRHFAEIVKAANEIQAGTSLSVQTPLIPVQPAHQNNEPKDEMRSTLNEVQGQSVAKPEPSQNSSRSSRSKPKTPIADLRKVSLQFDNMVPYVRPPSERNPKQIAASEKRQSQEVGDSKKQAKSKAKKIPVAGPNNMQPRHKK